MLNKLRILKTLLPALYFSVLPFWLWIFLAVYTLPRSIKDILPAWGLVRLEFVVMVVMAGFILFLVYANKIISHIESVQKFRFLTHLLQSSHYYLTEIFALAKRLDGYSLKPFGGFFYEMVMLLCLVAIITNILFLHSRSQLRGGALPSQQ